MYFEIFHGLNDSKDRNLISINRFLRLEFIIRTDLTDIFNT